jgi:hypothetical protein
MDGRKRKRPPKALPSEFTPRFLETLDGRSKASRELRDRLERLQGDAGGPALSYARQSLCRRAVWLESYVETMEARAAEGEPIDIAQQVQALNSLIGLYRAIGLERVARDIPTLQAYLAESKPR